MSLKNKNHSNQFLGNTVKQEDQSSIESSDGTNRPAPSEQSSPLRVDTTEEGRITVIVGAPPAVKGSASGLTSMQVERQLLTESSDNTNNDTQIEQSNPLRIDNTEEMLGKCIIIVGAPPPAK